MSRPTATKPIAGMPRSAPRPQATDHEQLLVRITELDASALISGYPHPVYDGKLANAGLERHQHPHNSTASRCPNGCGPRTEVVWRRLTCGAAERLPLWQAAQ